MSICCFSTRCLFLSTIKGRQKCFQLLSTETNTINNQHLSTPYYISNTTPIMHQDHIFQCAPALIKNLLLNPNVVSETLLMLEGVTCFLLRSLFLLHSFPCCAPSPTRTHRYGLTQAGLYIQINTLLQTRTHGSLTEQAKLKRSQEEEEDELRDSGYPQRGKSVFPQQLTQTALQGFSCNTVFNSSVFTASPLSGLSDQSFLSLKKKKVTSFQ